MGRFLSFRCGLDTCRSEKANITIHSDRNFNLSCGPGQANFCQDKQLFGNISLFQITQFTSLEQVSFSGKFQTLTMHRTKIPRKYKRPLMPIINFVKFYRDFYRIWLFSPVRSFRLMTLAFSAACNINKIDAQHNVCAQGGITKSVIS